MCHCAYGEEEVIRQATGDKFTRQKPTDNAKLAQARARASKTAAAAEIKNMRTRRQ